MSTEVSDAKVLIPEGRNVKIGDEEYYVPQFKFGKTVMMLGYITQLAKKSDGAALLEELGQGANVAVVLIKWLPEFFLHGGDTLFEAMGLAITPDKRLAEMDENGEDPKVEIKKNARLIKENADTEVAMQIMALIIDGMGLDQLRKNFPNLLRLLRN